jgi:hypothetical protein
VSIGLAGLFPPGAERFEVPHRFFQEPQS